MFLSIPSSSSSNDAWRETVRDIQKMYPYLLESEVPHIIVWANKRHHVPLAELAIGVFETAGNETNKNPRVQYQNFRVKKVINIFSLELSESSIGLQDV